MNGVWSGMGDELETQNETRTVTGDRALNELVAARESGARTRSPSLKRRGCVVGLALALAVGVGIAAFLVPLALNNRPPSAEQRSRSTALAQQDRQLLDEYEAGALKAMDVKVDRVINDFPTFGCYGNAMVANGSMANYTKRLLVPEGSETVALQRARDYLNQLNAERFGSRGQLSDPSEIDSPRRRVYLYVDQFTMSFSDEGADGFRVGASGPCRKG